MKYCFCFIIGLLFLVGCNPGSKWSAEKYIRITSDADSLREKYVLYREERDTSKTMIKFYWENGNLQTISFFTNSNKSGHWSHYSEDGKLSFEGDFVNGKKSGVHKMYHSNGKIAIQQEYLDGKETGLWHFYNAEGDLLRSEDHVEK